MFTPSRSLAIHFIWERIERTAGKGITFTKYRRSSWETKSCDKYPPFLMSNRERQNIDSLKCWFSDNDDIENATSQTRSASHSNKVEKIGNHRIAAERIQDADPSESATPYQSDLITKSEHAIVVEHCQRGRLDEKEYAPIVLCQRMGNRKKGIGELLFSSITVVVGEQAARIFGNRRGWSQALFVCNRADEKICALKFFLGGGQGERKERGSGWIAPANTAGIVPFRDNSGGKLLNLSFSFHTYAAYLCSVNLGL